MESDDQPGTGRRKVTRERTVTCENCDEFEMSKRFNGASATEGEKEWVGIDLPDECPVCGAETTVKSGGRA